MKEPIGIKKYIFLENEEGELSLVVESSSFKEISLEKSDVSLYEDSILITPERRLGKRSFKLIISAEHLNKVSSKGKLTLCQVNDSGQFDEIIEFDIIR